MLFVDGGNDRIGIGVSDPDCELEVSGTGAIKIPRGTTAQRPTDSYVSLLIHSDTTDGSTTFTDSSGKTVTVAGNTHHETDQKKFGDTSIHFDGTGDYLTLSDSSDFDFDNEDFTIELWIRVSNFSDYRHIFESRTSEGTEGFSFGTDSNGKLFMWYNGSFRITTSTTLSTATWYHVALVRNGNVHTIYINGTADTNTYTSANTYTSDRCWIGRYYNSTSYMYIGYMDEFCVSKGIARWTSNFTPPTEAYGGTATTGMIRYNTTTAAIEEFDGSAWVSLSSSFEAEGGTESTSGEYTYHTFTSSGTFSVLSGLKSISYLIVAGGGGGGYNAGAGGGAGGYRTGTATASSTVGNYTITIGAGGAGKTSDSGVADNGSNSSAFGVTSTGGGGGISSGGDGSNGGSGGGGSASGTGGSGTAGQGNDGGDGNSSDGANRSGAGGGGASAAGQDTPSNSQGGNGGAGSQWLNDSYYAGGGGGSPHSGSGGSGGTGGGGAGGTGNSSNGTAGTTNTGGGGGSGGGYGYDGANGGSGIVIIRYS
jgi:hypothetical protein